MSVFRDMIARVAQPGRVEAILLRPARLQDPVAVGRAEVTASGLAGDHGRPNKRAVTLVQAEHLAVIGAMLGQGPVAAHRLRRNLVISGLNLNALKGREVRIGGAVLRITGICAPCSRMETALGPGGYSAMRGHGGWCAEVVDGGIIETGGLVSPMDGTANLLS
jgi:MOSC domain-containing protein YiiM